MRKFIFFLIIVIIYANSCIAQQAEKIARVKIYSNSYQQIQSKGINIVHGYIKNKTFFEGEIYSSDIDKLKNSGLPYEIVYDDATTYYLERLQKKNQIQQRNIENNCYPPKTYSTPIHFGTGSMGGYYTYTETIAQLDSMRKWFPHLISQKQQIGLSIENRPIYAVKITDNPDINENEKQILFTAVHHSSEPAGLQQLIFFMYYLLENYQTDDEIRFLIDNLEIYFVPIINPDGYVYNETQNPNGGGTWRKNRRYVGIGVYGVDLNRNYGYAFAYDEIGSSSIPVHPWYRGAYAFSEPESSTMKNFIESHNFLLDMNWHAWGNFVIYPWNYRSSNTPDSTLYEQFARYITLENHYRYGTCQQTYGYNSNGDADDWGYGDTTNKNKVISLTAEIGSAYDGFWPDISNIEELSKKSLDMNLRYARLGTKFALVNDLSQPYISSTQTNIPFEVYCLGLNVPADFTVSITPISNNIISTGSPVMFSGMNTLERRYDSIALHIDPSAVPGSEIVFSLNISNGLFTWKDTITKTFCTPTVFFSDAADNFFSWNNNGWGITTNTFASPPSCFTDSPSGNYGIFNNSSITLNTPIDLTQAGSAWLGFRAKWEIEKSYDWVQVLVSSDNGTTWQPLCGKHTSYGTDDQRESEPVYDGYVNQWVQEQISLNDYLGETIKLKFEFHSDQSNHFDGFYLDDIKIWGCADYTGINTAFTDNFDLYPNPAVEQITISAKSKHHIRNIQIYDLYGRQILNPLFSCHSSSLTININELSNGTYFLFIETENQQKICKKFVVINPDLSLGIK